MQPTLSFWDCGEFIASAFTLSIPHPPGAPLWILLGKIASLLPFGSNPAVKMNALSALCSGVTVTLIYLVIVSVIKNWRGFPKDSLEALLVFGSAIIGALSYAFSDAFWFNATESEVYSMAAMLIALCVWLLMHWYENADRKGNEKLLLLFAFIIGLSLGVHLLVTQMILVAGILYYFRKYQYSRITFFIAFIITCASFLLIYPVIVIYYPLLFANFKIIAILLFAALTVGIIFTLLNNKKNWSFALTAIVFIILGYTVYTSVLLRAKTDNLPINENNPQTLHSLASYISREQYGDAPFFPRRYSQEPENKRMFTNYSGDIDFMWRYQVNHMFNRYLGWQFIGRAGYNRDSGIDWSKFYGIPFILGLFGLFYHFRKDWKLGLTFLWMFVLMGVVTALFQRQQDPQPRERDYFYIGAFFVYSMWIGIGIMGILELIKESIQSSSGMKAAGVTILIAGFIFVPANMLRVNFHHQNRHDNYVPFDYAYNLLQSADKDAILFTNGDNDTFPLWYLQAAEGYRTDVRVINLSLLNAGWYIKELRDSSPYGSQKIPIDLTDEQIKQLQPVKWDEFKNITLKIPPETFPDSLKKNAPDKLNWKMPGTFSSDNGKAVRVQDLMLLQVLKANNWKRPIYFSNGVSDENYIGLDEYLVTEGMAKRLVPFKSDEPVQFRIDEKKMSENFLSNTGSFSKAPQTGFSFRGFTNQDIFFDQTASNIVQSYRSQFLSFAFYYNDEDDNSRALTVLDKMESLFPRKVVPMDFKIEYDAAMLYNRLGNKNKFNDMSSEVEKAALEQMKKNPNDIKSYWNPYKILIDIYEARGEYSNAIDILDRLDGMSPNTPEIKQKIELLKNKSQGNQ